MNEFVDFLGEVAIVGLGGTGAYLLDYLAKCPVKEIHLFDDDFFDTHNAFRCPGAASIEDLNTRPRWIYADAPFGGTGKKGRKKNRSRFGWFRRRK